MVRPRHSPPNPDRITIRIDPKLAERVRVLAARRKQAISAVIEEALFLYIREAERAWEKKAKGGSEPHSMKAPILKNRTSWTPDQVRQELKRLETTQTRLAAELEVRPSLLSLWLGRRGIPYDRQQDLTKAIQALRRRHRQQ